MPKRIHGPRNGIGKISGRKTIHSQQLYPRHTGSPTGQRGKYYCYVGRLSEEKGVETLLEAATMLQHELRIAGSGPLYGKLKAKYDSWPQITFLGQLDSDGVAKLLGEAACSVLPSEWYENNPLGIIESLCAGTPVVGAEIGGIPELIDDNNGLTFTPGIPRHWRRQ